MSPKLDSLAKAFGGGPQPLDKMTSEKKGRVGESLLLRWLRSEGIDHKPVSGAYGGKPDELKKAGGKRPDALIIEGNEIVIADSKCRNLKHQLIWRITEREMGEYRNAIDWTADLHGQEATQLRFFIFLIEHRAEQLFIVDGFKDLVLKDGEYEVDLRGRTPISIDPTWVTEAVDEVNSPKVYRTFASQNSA